MKEIAIETCPYCGGTRFLKGYTVSSYGIFPISSFAGSGKGSPLEHTVCEECGSIVHTRVMKINKLREVPKF